MIGKAIASIHTLPEGAADQFDAFHALLCQWNTRMDLTAVTDEEEALCRHYLDSLAALPLLPENARVIDVGTGAGFPGIPLSIARPDLQIALLDARSKRVRFLQYATEALGLTAKAVHGRAEDYARENRETCDVAVCRAVAAMPVLLEWMLPLVKVGGSCVLWKGPGADEELAQAMRVAPLLGGGEIQLAAAEIPGRDWHHMLAVVQKVESTGERFPRKAGMAIKRPL